MAQKKEKLIKSIKETWKAQRDFTKLNQLCIMKILPTLTVKELKGILMEEEIDLWHLEQEYKNNKK